MWCEQVKYLNLDNRGSSHSETSVATSTTNSTLYLLSSRRVLTDKGVQQLWCKFGAVDDFVRKYQQYLLSQVQISFNIEHKKMARSASLYGQLVRLFTTTLRS